MSVLTRKQNELLLFINKRLNDDGVSPSFDEMKEARGVKLDTELTAEDLKESFEPGNECAGVHGTPVSLRAGWVGTPQKF